MSTTAKERIGLGLYGCGNRTRALLDSLCRGGWGALRRSKQTEREDDAILEAACGALWTIRRGLLAGRPPRGVWRMKGSVRLAATRTHDPGRHVCPAARAMRGDPRIRQRTHLAHLRPTGVDLGP